MKVIDRFTKRVSPVPIAGCWLWTGGTNGVYGQLYYEGHYIGAHRASWLLHRGAIPRGGVVCHECDVPLCVNPAHLFVGTHADNVADKMRKGRNRTGDHRGAQNPRAKLSDEQVREIRRASGTLTEIGLKYGVSFATIWGIKRGKKWRHVQ